MSGSTPRVFYKAPIMKMEEEEEIVNYAIEKAKKDGEINRGDVINKVLSILKRNNRRNTFRTGAPGDKWFHLVRLRHAGKFQRIDRTVLKLLESLGFTERVKITSKAWKSQSCSPGLKLSLVPKKLSPKKQQEHSPTSNLVQTETTSPIEQNEEEDFNTEDGETTDFQPGSKLEVMDFNEKWYPVKVVEVDYEEGEVLVHFEKWSDRYDEWVPMDSNRVRRPILPKPVNSKKLFKKNEKVIAVWAYNHKYPAVIRQVLTDDKYEVLFSDGYIKVLRGCKLFKASKEDLQNVLIPPPKKPAPPMGADPIDPNLGPKEERRLKKRKMDVLEAYLPQKRQRADVSQSNPESSPVTHSCSQSLTPQHTPKSSPAPTNRTAMEKDDNDDDDEDRMWIDEDYTAAESSYGKFKKKKISLLDSTASPSSSRTGGRWSYSKDDPDRWGAEIPDGIVPVTITEESGHTRESIIVPDKKLPLGWSKHTVQRKTGAKWDVFLVNSEGKKFRSRKELREHFKELNQPFPEDQVDFTVGPKIEAARSAKRREKLMNKHRNICRSSETLSRAPYEGESDNDSKPDKATLTTNIIKIKREPATLHDTKPLSHGASSSPSQLAPAFSFSEMKSPDGGYTCCGKHFRKESLLQMHLKHYHPEYSGLLGSSPNMADLAYARTVGTPVEDYSRAESLTPRATTYVRPTPLPLPLPIKTEPKPLSEKKTPSTPTVKPPKEKVRLVAEIVEDVIKKIPKEEKKRVEEHYENKRQKEVDEQSDGSIEGDELDSRQDDSRGSPSPPPSDESKSELLDEKSEEISQGDTKEKKTLVDPELQSSSRPTTPPVVEVKPPPQPPASPTHCTSSSLPVIKPVSKLTFGSKSSVSSEALIVQTTSSPKAPITITKYVPPGQKPATSTSLTKVTISLNSTKTDVGESNKERERDAAIKEENVAVNEDQITTKEGKAMSKDWKATTKEEKSIIKEGKTLAKEEKVTIIKEGKNLAKDIKLTIKEGKVLTKDSKLACKEGKAITKEVKPYSKEGNAPVKEGKGTIKTLLPMRPPPLVEPKEVPEEQKPKDIKLKENKEETQEEVSSNKGRPRKRTVSDSMPRKPKLVKPSTGSLEEQPSDVSEHTTCKVNKSYRFSRNRTQLPRVSLEKLNTPTKANGADETVASPKFDGDLSNYVSALPPDAPALAPEASGENLRKEEIINCTCGFMEEDGLMIQCDLCLCWQHGLCNNIDKEGDVPEKYICYICTHPARQRASRRFGHNTDWIKDGKLPSFSFTEPDNEQLKQQESTLMRSHQLAGSLLQLQMVISSLRVKAHIATKPGHPKLYLWAKSWKNGSAEEKEEHDVNKEGVVGPQPEAAIDESECRLKLLEHVEDYQNQMEDRLTSIQAQIAALESEDPDLATDETSDNYPITKQTVQMILRDLGTVQQVVALTS